MEQIVKKLVIHISKDKDLPGEPKIVRNYSDKGLVIREMEFAEQTGEIVTQTFYEYDDKGRETLKKIVYTEDQQVSQIQEWDDKDRLKSSKTILADGRTSNHREYMWNEEGNHEEVTLLDEEGEYLGKEIRKFNDDHWLLEEIFMDDEDEVLEQYTYSYDSKGGLIKKVDDFQGFQTEHTYTYTFDNGDRITQLVIQDDEGETSMTKTAYSDSGKKIREEIIHPNEASEIIFYNEESGEISAEEKYDETGFKIMESNYVYDENNGKLICKHVLTDGKYYRVDYVYNYHGDDDEEE